MAEETDQASRTEEATPRKLEDARRRGDVAKSPDVASWMSLAAAVGVLISLGGPLSTHLAAALTVYFSSPSDLADQLNSGGGAEIARRALMAGAPLMGAVMVAAALAGGLGHVIQQGVLFAPEKLKPDFSKVSPAQGFKRLFGIDGLGAFVRTLVKVTLTGWVAWRAMEAHQSEVAGAAGMAPAAVLAFSRHILIALFSSALTFLGVTAALDWLWQRQRFLQRMRMSRHELKEDFRQSEGDPHIKARLKQLRLARSRRRMMTRLKTATVVVTNPTHFAVALRYVADETAAPECVAKGVDSLALKIRQIAGENGIPVIEDPPLARALYAAVDLDETIPREHYEAVAKLIGFVMGRKQRRPIAPSQSGALRSGPQISRTP